MKTHQHAQSQSQSKLVWGNAFQLSKALSVALCLKKGCYKGQTRRGKWFHAKLITNTNQRDGKITLCDIVVQCKMYGAFWHFKFFLKFNLWLVLGWLVEKCCVIEEGAQKKCRCGRHSAGNLPYWLPANVLVHMDAFITDAVLRRQRETTQALVRHQGKTMVCSATKQAICFAPWCVCGLKVCHLSTDIFEC